MVTAAEDWGRGNARAALGLYRREMAPYDAEGKNPTTNAGDHVNASEENGANLLALSGDDAAGYTAAVTIVLPITSNGAATNPGGPPASALPERSRMRSNREDVPQHGAHRRTWQVERARGAARGGLVGARLRP
jgi:hypothetical protein